MVYIAFSMWAFDCHSLNKTIKEIQYKKGGKFDQNSSQNYSPGLLAINSNENSLTCGNDSIESTNLFFLGKKNPTYFLITDFKTMPVPNIAHNRNITKDKRKIASYIITSRYKWSTICSPKFKAQSENKGDF